MWGRIKGLTHNLSWTPSQQPGVSHQSEAILEMELLTLVGPPSCCRVEQS